MALTQLVSRGRQDDALTAELAPSFFGKTYVARAPFALEQVEQVWDGTVDWGQRLSCDISRRGDLVTGMMLEISMRKRGNGYYPAEELIERAELWMGKTLVQALEGDYLRVHQELFHSSDQKSAYARMTDFVDGEADGTLKTFFLRLPWYFDGKPHLAVPLVAAQYHALNVVLHLSKEVRGVDTAAPPEVRLFVEYAFLATNERRKVAKVEHSFVIEQIQYQRTPIQIEEEPRQHKVALAFNHPARWIALNFGNPIERARYTAGDAGETSEALGVLADLTLTLNGTDRFQRRSGAFLNSYTPYASFPHASQPRAGVYFYSFNHTPDRAADLYASDSTLNFSRVDAPVLHFTTKAANAATVDAITHPAMTLTTARRLDVLRVYACTLNVLSVKSGMFGLRYAN